MAQAVLHAPASKTVLVLGTDDIRPGLFVALEAANRLWAGLRSESNKSIAPVGLLPGGSFLFKAGQDESATLVLSGESTPNSWEEILIGAVDELKDCTPAQLALAGAEPLVVAEGGWTSSFWRRPLLSIPTAATDPEWRDSLLALDAVTFGASTDERASLDFETAPEADAFAITPRSAIPGRFPQSAAPLKPSAVITHRHAKDEAMALWSIGFAPPTIVGPSETH